MIKPKFLRGVCTALSVYLVAASVSGCKTQDLSSHYSSDYIHNTDGKLSVEVPEAYELGYTILALTQVAQNDANLINKNTAYYQEMMARFGKFKDHRAVTTLNAILTRHPELFKSFRNGLSAFRMHDGRFVQNENYRIDVSKFGFTRFAHLFKDFYSDSNFNKFYAEHSTQYAQMVQRANSYLNFQSAQKMFKDQKSYRMILSPLMKGQPGTLGVKSGSYSELLIFPYLGTDGLVYADRGNTIAATHISE